MFMVRIGGVYSVDILLPSIVFCVIFWLPGLVRAYLEEACYEQEVVNREEG